MNFTIHTAQCYSEGAFSNPPLMNQMCLCIVYMHISTLLYTLPALCDVTTKGLMASAERLMMSHY